MIKKITLLLTLSFAFTQIGTAQTLLSEGFEGATFPPAGWTSFIGTNGLGTANDWMQTDNASNTGTYSAANVYENVTGGIAEDWLVTSQIDLTSASNTELLFYAAQSYGTNYGSIYEVKVSTASQTAHADFTTVASYTEPALGAGGFNLKTIDLSAYDGMMIYIAFVHLNDDGDNWILDDIEVRSPLSLDAQIESVNLNRYSLQSVDNQLSIRVKNNGTTAFTSLEVNWNDGTTDHVSTISVNIAPNNTAVVSHPMMVNYGAIAEKDINITVNLVNGVSDDDSSNNSIISKFNTISQAGTKAVLIEESTGTWCGWCPRGTIGLDYMSSTYPNTVVAIAVHNGDPMTVAAYDTGLVNTIGSGWPNSGLDRKLLGVDPGQATLQGGYNTQINELTPVDLFAGATQAGNTLTIDANATFYTNFGNASSDYKLGVIITEDNVTGTTSGYNHTNYYSGGSSGPMGGYENLPDPVPAAQMVYNHVGRALLGGFDGQSNSLPASINAGDTASYSFNYTIPATSNQANMHIVVVLIDATDGSIVSAQQSSVAQALSVEEVSGISTIKIYPNPAKDNLNISFEAGNGDYDITVTDLLGRSVINKTYTGVFGFQNIQLPVSNLNAGHYLLNINDGNASYSSKFIVNK